MREHAEGLLVSSDGVDREFFASFVSTPEVSRLRSLKAVDLGRLVSFSGAPLLPGPTPPSPCASAAAACSRRKPGPARALNVTPRTLHHDGLSARMAMGRWPCMDAPHGLSIGSHSGQEPLGGGVSETVLANLQAP